MYAIMDAMFKEWLSAEMKTRGWSQAELARRANTSRSAINGLLSGWRGPGPDLARSIAHALKLPDETVFRAAGLLSPVSDDEAKFEDWKYLLEGLSERDLSILRDLAEKMAAENEKERALKSLNPRRVGNG
jgi:transcriptional regulator with XRE-family HTH domain